ncbi:MAG: hypothetical protein ACYCVB_15475 [Bacilli bacterium]
MQIIPAALGQSEGVITLWDDNRDIAMALPRETQFISELQWGAGVLDDDPCLILYLFVGRQTIELYLPERLPTAPEQQVAVWQTILQWRPEVLRVRYGESPLARQYEVTFLLPKEEGETAADKLQAFVKQLEASESDREESDDLTTQLLRVLSPYTQETQA